MTIVFEIPKFKRKDKDKKYEKSDNFHNYPYQVLLNELVWRIEIKISRKKPGRDSIRELVYKFFNNLFFVFIKIYIER